jgi:glycosyltransferase involved in cell wall biosynthesis
VNKSAPKVVLVAYHLHPYPGYRPTMLHRYLSEKGAAFASYRCLAADWDHFKKTRQSFGEDGRVRMIEVPAYRKNISFARAWSYFVFALKVLKDPDFRTAEVVITCVPPNVVALMIAFFAGRKKRVVDVVDLWPDALPLPKPLKTLVMATLGIPWVLSRNFAYARATRLVSHCRFFLQRLGFETNPKSAFIPLYQFDESAFAAEARRPSLEERIVLCVLGSVNNVLDVDSLVAFSRHIVEAGRPLRLEVLGDGESKPRLLTELKRLGVEIFDHGVSYDPKLRHEILTRCHFGYNGYKGTTAIGITYKSIDFTSFGLPILNSVGGDLKTLVPEYGCGFHYESGSEQELATKILRLNDSAYAKMCEGARALAEKYFRKSAFERRWDEVLDSL